MSINSNPGKRVPARQHDQLSNHGGLKDRRDQAISSQMSHEDRSQHEAHGSSEASSTKGESPRFENQGRIGCGNAQGDAGYLQPGEERRNKSYFEEVKSWGRPSKPKNENTFNKYHEQEKKHLQEHIYQLQEQNDQQVRLISELRSDIEQEIQKGKEIKQSADKMAYAMENKELLIGRQDSDEDIYSRFRSLVGQIKTWSLPFAQIHQDARAYSMGTIEEFRKISPGVTDFQRFLYKPKNVRLLVRGYVGLAIAESLFRTVPYAPNLGSHGEDVWMNKELAHSFASVENSLFHSNRNLIPARDFHDWRALTATLISRLNTNNKTDEGTEMGTRACSTRIMSLVANWVAAENQGKLEDGLREILSDAVKLSQTLRCQRAFWSIRQAGSIVNRAPNAGRADSLLYFDERTMDDRYGDEDSDGRSIPTFSPKKVEIIISPSLWKCGNTDGERYDIEFCAERSEVKCKRPSSSREP